MVAPVRLASDEELARDMAALREVGRRLDRDLATAAQVPLLLDVLGAFGLATSGADGFEADDVIATIAANDPGPVEVVTGDRDLLALATDRVRILYTGRGMAKLADLGPAEILSTYGVPAGAELAHAFRPPKREGASRTPLLYR